MHDGEKEWNCRETNKREKENVRWTRGQIFNQYNIIIQKKQQQQQPHKQTKTQKSTHQTDLIINKNFNFNISANFNHFVTDIERCSMYEIILGLHCLIYCCHKVNEINWNRFRLYRYRLVPCFCWHFLLHWGMKSGLILLCPFAGCSNEIINSIENEYANCRLKWVEFVSPALFCQCTESAAAAVNGLLDSVATHMHSCDHIKNILHFE